VQLFAAARTNNLFISIVVVRKHFISYWQKPSNFDDNLDIHLIITQNAIQELANYRPYYHVTQGFWEKCLFQKYKSFNTSIRQLY